MKKEKGMTLVGLLLTVSVLGMAAVLVLRIVPVYIQYYSIIQSIKSLSGASASTLNDDSIANIDVLRKDLAKRLDVNGLDDLKEDQLTISASGSNEYTVRLKYQVIKPLLYNVSLQFNFDDTEKVIIGSEH